MEYAIIVFAILVIAAAFFVGGIVDERSRKARFLEKLRTDYGKPSGKSYPDGRLKTIGGYAKHRHAEFMLDDITWNDLDMDRVFRMLDFTNSAAGEEYLYAMLRSPMQKDEEFERLEELVSYFMQHNEERIRLQLLFARIGRTGKYSIFDYLDYLDELGERKNTWHYALLFAMAISLGLCFVSGSLGVGCLGMCVLTGIMSYFREKREIMPYLTTFSYLLRLVRSVGEFEALHMDILNDEVVELKACRDRCRSFSRGSYLVTSMNRTSSDPMEIVLDYVKMIFHVDLIKFNRMLRQARRCKHAFVAIFEITGRLEAYISIGAYRSSVPYYAVPEFLNADGGGIRMEAQQIVHPLLTDPVANSFCSEGGMLLTGSNASGKSTFLKTAAVAAVMAQSVHTVTARSYRAPILRIYTSMSLRDDLKGGDSYFIVEIKALKRILDAKARQGRPIVCFVDEVLRGTNTVERIAASCEILRNLSDQGCLCFAATHDIELTDLLEGQYANYHFEEKIEHNDVLFNYRLMEGKAQTRNAIQLLRILGFDDRIIRRAGQRAEIFVDKGVWRK